MLSPIHLPIHHLTYPSVLFTCHPLIHLSAYLSTHPSIHLSILPSMDLFNTSATTKVKILAFLYQVDFPFLELPFTALLKGQATSEF